MPYIHPVVAIGLGLWFFISMLMVASVALDPDKQRAQGVRLTVAILWPLVVFMVGFVILIELIFLPQRDNPSV